MLLLFALFVRATSLCSPDSLDRAQSMFEHPSTLPQRRTGAEFEGSEFWEENAELFTCAWEIYGQKHAALYTFDEFFEQEFISPDLNARRAQLLQDPTIEHELKLRELFSEIAPGVWATQSLFSLKFCKLLSEELTFLSKSRIPVRRPNGMNRYGAILEDLGFGDMMRAVVSLYLRPLALTLMPNNIKPTDAEDFFSFVVRYKKGEDVDLKRHRDAAVATLNLCLGTDFFEGGTLRFYHESSDPLQEARFFDYAFVPGTALIHSGQLEHAALPLTAGERQNLILWLFGKDGYVRAAPYEEALDTKARWESVAALEAVRRQNRSGYEPAQKTRDEVHVEL